MYKNACCKSPSYFKPHPGGKIPGREMLSKKNCFIINEINS